MNSASLKISSLSLQIRLFGEGSITQGLILIGHFFDAMTVASSDKNCL